MNVGCIYIFLKNIELHKKCKKHGALRKKGVTEVINFGFSKPEKEKFISSKKLMWNIRKILFNT